MFAATIIWCKHTNAAIDSVRPNGFERTFGDIGLDKILEIHGSRRSIRDLADLPNLLPTKGLLSPF